MDHSPPALRAIESLVVPASVRLVPDGRLTQPYRLIDGSGSNVDVANAYLLDLKARGHPDTSLYSYGMALVRWFRFLDAVDVAWDRAGREEARDFMLWFQTASKPARRRSDAPAAGSVNAITGKRYPGTTYAKTTAAHNETVVRVFYDYLLELPGGPLLNPFPLMRARGGRAYAHHNPMEPFARQRTGLYRPQLPTLLPRSIPDHLFNDLFAALPSHRDRALVAFYVSTGARASELLSSTQARVDIGRQAIAVVRKGTQELQWLPASADAFVWLRLYQELDSQAPVGPEHPLWWTLRRPVRPLTYHALRAMLERANQKLGTNWTLHDLRHTAAYRMAEDPELSLTDVQWVLGHARLTTTQLYLRPREQEVIAHVQAHLQRRAAQPATPAIPSPGPGYRSEVLDTLFGTG